VIRQTIAGLIAAGVLFGAGAGMAGASQMTVTQAIKAQDKIVSTNPTYKSLKGFKVTTVAQAKQVIPKIKKLQGVIDNAATVVSGASATSAQKAGQKDWVAGTREQGRGIGGLAAALTDLVNGKKAAAKTALVNALKLVSAGDKLSIKGDNLLGLPIDD
jgi:hypothetical protein